MRKKVLGLSAFSLVEVLVASFIFTILGSLVALYLAQGIQSWEVGITQADLQAQARPAMDKMLRELKNATRTDAGIPSPQLSIPAAPDNNSITFYLPQDQDGDGTIIDATGNIEWNTDNPIKYQRDASLNQLIRTVEDDTGNVLSREILCTDVSSVEFIDASIDSSLFLNELKIILDLQKITNHG
jgi:type II secretory pathway pseudopilin PulG